MIFFSYSRKDSKFALKLALKLREAGTNIWIDQLDIKGGNHWDVDIENALNSAECIIAIFSAEAINSKNVMDELSYALDENKKIIPIVLDNCKIPFRLRRLHHLDFTGDFDEAFEQLVNTLGNNNTDVNSSTLHKDKVFSKRKTSLWIYWMIAGITVAALITYLVIRTTKNEDNKDAVETFSGQNDSIQSKLPDSVSPNIHQQQTKEANSINPNKKTSEQKSNDTTTKKAVFTKKVNDSSRTEPQRNVIPRQENVAIQEKIKESEIPKAFSPNGDKINDVFKFDVNRQFDKFEIGIYNRWGMLLFESNNNKSQWDGTWKGVSQEAGSYIWTIEYKFTGANEVHKLNGNVVLVK